MQEKQKKIDTRRMYQQLIKDNEVDTQAIKNQEKMQDEIIQRQMIEAIEKRMDEYNNRDVVRRQKVVMVAQANKELEDYRRSVGVVDSVKISPKVGLSENRMTNIT